MSELLQSPLSQVLRLGWSCLTELCQRRELHAVASATERTDPALAHRLESAVRSAWD